MLKKKKELFSMSWVGRELIIVMLAQKKKTNKDTLTHTYTDAQTHTYTHSHKSQIQFSSMKFISLHIIREDILIFRYSEEC